MAVVAAMLRVFAAAGDRTNRKRARLKYVLERWGIERFVAETEALLGTALRRLPLERCAEPGPVVRGAHVGVHRQRQPDRNWVGAGVPGGRLSGDRMAALADLARDLPCALILIQHPPKPQRPGDATHAYSGSSDWRNMPRALVALEALRLDAKGKPAADGEHQTVRLRMEKSNYAALPPRAWLRFAPWPRFETYDAPAEARGAAARTNL